MTQANAQLSGNLNLTFKGTAGGGISELDDTSATLGLTHMLELAKTAYSVQAKKMVAQSKTLADIQGVFDLSSAEPLPASFQLLKAEVKTSIEKTKESIGCLESDIDKLEELERRAKIFDNGGMESEEVAQETPQEILQRAMANKTLLNTKQGKLEFIAALPHILKALKESLAKEGEKQFGSAPMAEPAKCPGCAGCQPNAAVFDVDSISQQDQEYLKRAIKAGLANGTMDIVGDGYVGLRGKEGQSNDDIIEELIESEKAKEAQTKAGPKISGSAMQKFLDDLVNGTTELPEPEATLDGMIARRFQAKENGIDTRHPESVIQALTLLGVEIPPAQAPAPKGPQLLGGVEELFTQFLLSLIHARRPGQQAT